MVYETTLSDHNRHLDLIADAKAQGFEVWVLYVGLGSADRHVRRVRSRVEDGGHSVPDTDIVRRYARSLKNIVTVIPRVDRVLMYDNSGQDLRREQGSGWWLPLLEGLTDQDRACLWNSEPLEEAFDHLAVMGGQVKYKLHFAAPDR
jgi:hypothetical protein